MVWLKVRSKAEIYAKIVEFCFEKLAIFGPSKEAATSRNFIFLKLEKIQNFKKIKFFEVTSSLESQNMTIFFQQISQFPHRFYLLKASSNQSAFIKGDHRYTIFSNKL